MVLYIVGIGLVPQDITVRGIETAKSCTRVFLDGYTSVQVEDGLVSLLKADIEVLDRDAVESDRLIDMASEEDVCLLVPGDGMTATTHLTLVMECVGKGIDVDVVPGISIATVVPGMLGLQWYKFGRATTVPFPQEGYSPDSPYKAVRSNLKAGLHTLVLLDIRPEGMMTASEGLGQLMDMAARAGESAINSETTVAAVARAGASDQIAVAGRLERVMATDLGPPPHAVVIPGELHFMEQDALKRFWIE